MRATTAARPLVGGPGLGRATIVLGAGIVLVIGAVLLAVAVGSVEVGLGDAVGIVAQRLGLPVAETWPSTAPTILFEVRLPRVLAGVLVGAGLAGAGVVFQALLRNPMADPYVIGSAAGASLGAVVETDPAHAATARAAAAARLSRRVARVIEPPLG